MLLGELHVEEGPPALNRGRGAAWAPSMVGPLQLVEDQMHRHSPNHLKRLLPAVGLMLG